MTNEEQQPIRQAGLPSFLARARSVNPKLILVSGRATTEEIEMQLPFSIGRMAGSSLVIHDPSISRHHCDIVHRDDYLWVYDQGSSNGTFLNGSRVKKAVVRPGDRLKIGSLTFIVQYKHRGRAAKLDLAKQRAAEKQRRAAQRAQQPGRQVLSADSQSFRLQLGGSPPEQDSSSQTDGSESDTVLVNEADEKLLPVTLVKPTSEQQEDAESFALSLIGEIQSFQTKLNADCQSVLDLARVIDRKIHGVLQQLDEHMGS